MAVKLVTKLALKKNRKQPVNKIKLKARNVETKGAAKKQEIPKIK